MKLKKVIINGKVYYQEDVNGDIDTLEKEENVEVHAEVITDHELVDKILKYTEKIEEKFKKYDKKINDEFKEYKEKLSDTVMKFKEEFKKVLDEDELDDLYDDCLNELDDIYDDYDQSTSSDERKSTIFDSDFGSKLSDSLNKAFSKVFVYPNKKNSEKGKNLIALLPFMDKEDIHDIVLSIINKNGDYENFDISILMPFVSSDDAILLFDYALENECKCNLAQLAAFVSADKLEKVVDLYIEGKITDIKIETLYPFLNTSSIKKLFEYYKSK